MNNYFKKILLCVAVATIPHVLHAANITIDSPNAAVPSRQPIVVRIFLDTENKMVSGIGGDFSFPTDMFVLQNISTEDSVIPLWLNQPSVSEEKYFDNRTHLTFEGIFPGGYSGVRSPYYQGERPGILFTVVLVPKNKGSGVLLLDNITLNSFTREATPIPVESAVKIITVPNLLSLSDRAATIPVRIKKQTLSTFVTRDPLVNNNAWYLVVDDQGARSAISALYVAETDDYDAEAVKENDWQMIKSPYVLLYQDRTKNIHTKVIYSDNTYTTNTIHAVENFTSISYISRILVGVAMALFLLYTYGKDLLIFSKKK